MERDSRTLEEVFNARFPLETFENPVKIIQAIGYLTALGEFITHEKWIEETRTSLEYLLFKKFDIYLEGK